MIRRCFHFLCRRFRMRAELDSSIRPPNEPDVDRAAAIARQVREASRRRFDNGELFQPLIHAAGAAGCCCVRSVIRETGGGEDGVRHILTVTPDASR